MQLIKLVYEWIGPAGPISNNDYPNLFDLKRQYNYHQEDSNYMNRTPTLYQYLTDLDDLDVQIVPASSVKVNDLFLYEINIDYKHPFWFDSLYIGTISPRIRHIMNDDNSRGYYAFNMSLEGLCNYPFLVKFYEFLRRNNINTGKVIFFCGSMNAEAIHNEWYKRNGIVNPIKVVSCNDYYKISKQRINNKKSRSKKFVCFNRRWKPHRLLLYVYLHKNKLLDNFYFSIPRESVSDSAHSFYVMTKDLVSRYSMDIDHNDILAAYNDLPMVLDDSNFEKLNWWENSKLSQFHYDSYISIVTETMFEEREVFPTEKTFRSMSFAQPFITLGSTGFLEGLHSMGFKTFSDVIDESYDTITNNSDRIKYQLEMIKDMCSWPESRFEEIVTNTQPACLHNYHLLSTNIPKGITTQQLGKIIDNR